jgi:hypothetical protein
MQTSGSSVVLSTGIFDTRSIQSWIALVTCGTIYGLFTNLGKQSTLSIAGRAAHLYCFPQVIPSTLFIHESKLRTRLINECTRLLLDDLPVDFSRGDIVIARERDIQISFIVAKIQIHFTTVIEDINLA